ncbi:c-type cytochrome domain-containing protein [Zavarzinella formosa]|uniref:c-type cytochrome domain-containing protein n=1 Tax=Zavarzinella formosa TaxID=360055 RepID=UPI0002FE321E|nr:c-type cytochrome domain-containing protein [Zavarzinella formosa]
MLPRLILLLAFPAFVAAESPNPLALKAQAVFKTHCHRCHGENGTLEGGMNYLLDLDRMVARKKIVPGKSAESPVFKRMVAGTMPPQDVKDRLSEADMQAVRVWIDAGAPPLIPTSGRKTISAADVQENILADLEKIDRRARRFQRYITLTHLWNAGLADDELRTYRNAVAKVINSLSWHPKVRNPEPIDPHETIFRIDLRWYMWDATIWNRLLQEYPYGLLDDGATLRTIMVFTATKVPTIRGDWFVASASRPPLYQDLLQLPGNLAELERQLRVDASLNIQQERVMRVAFNGSGISRNNRILERHDSVHGYYWRTYDFEEIPQNLIDRGLSAPDRRNVFAYPLGPGSVENTFQHAGGEAIFSLPNGLQGYFIMDAVNNRINKALTAIVADPRRPDKAVELGVSCMGCHVPGIITKADQMRDHLEKSPKAVSKADAEVAMALYPSKDKSSAQMDEDSRKYREALEKTGSKVSRTEPVIAMTLRYEGDLELAAAAAEVGLAPAQFREKLAESEALSRAVGSLAVPGGTISRQVWIQSFGDLVRDLKMGTLFQSTQIGATLPDNTGEVDPLEVSAGQANQIAFSVDGRRALIASADRSIRYVEVEGKRDLKRLVGHTSSVWAVALSPDGKKAISGGMDGTVRLWDIETTLQKHKLEGHTGLVTAVAFTHDGTQAISGGLDGFAILWDLETGREVRRWRGPMKYVNAVAVAPDDSTAIIAADHKMWLWDLETGKAIRTFEGHTGPVTSVAFDAEGKHLVSAGDDAIIRLWDVGTGKSIGEFKGHEGSIRSAEFSANGKWLLSAGADCTVRLWKVADRKEAGAFRRHIQPVVRASFVNNGTQTVSGDRNGTVLLWNIQKFLPKPMPK